MDSAISLKKFLYCSLFFILFASNESFAQDTVMQKRNSIGIEVGHFLLEPSIYFQQDRGRWLYQLKVGYTPGNYEWGNGLNGNGYVVGGEIDFKLNKRKNFPYYAAGFYHSYVFIDSTVIADEMKAESYRYEGTYFGLRQALGIYLLRQEQTYSTTIVQQLISSTYFFPLFLLQKICLMKQIMVGEFCPH